MTYCGEHSLVKVTDTERQAVSLRCKAWTCPNCAPDRKRQLIAQAIRGSPNKFLTLTSRRRDGVTAEQAARDLSHGWRIIRLRLMRHYKLKKLPFLAVVEKHKSGWPHLHILLRATWLSQKLISQWADEVFNGPIVWIEHLDKSHKAAIYCSKYCGKATSKFDSTKRYWQSRDYQTNPKKDKQGRLFGDGTFCREEHSVRRWATHWTWCGFDVRWISTHVVIASKEGPP